MKRILIYTGHYVIDHPDRDIPLVRELRRRGYRVIHCVAGQEIIDPGYPKSILSNEGFRTIETRWVNHWRDLKWLIAASDVVVVGMSKGVGRVVEVAKSLHIPTVQHENVGSTDSYYFGADWVCVRGPFFKEWFLTLYGDKVPAERVVVTGATQFDRAQWPEIKRISRDEFCHIYGLNPDKRIAVWLPDGPQCQDEWMQNKYVEVCQMVRDSGNHSLVIKPHTGDYLKRKSARYLNGKHSWEALVPWATVVLPEHGYVCFNVCDVGIGTQSSVSLEFPLFKKPFIYVEPNKSPILSKLSPFYPYPVSSWVGIECNASELQDILAHERYVVADEQLYEEHIARYCYKNDGLAYKRIADLIDEVAQQVKPGYRWQRQVKLAARESKRLLSRMASRLSLK